MAVVTPADREEIRRRLREDYAYYPERALKIVTKQSAVVPFRLKRAQMRLARGLMGQREAGLPQRAVILKARQVGFSTQAQGLMVQRATQIENHRALVVAQDVDTAGDLFEIGHGMWARLPAQIKPPSAYARNSPKQKFILFGEPALSMRKAGIFGLNSRITISTARDTSGGRGKTIHSLHLSEVAWWEMWDKLLGLLNAVPDDPDSLVLMESTPRGYNVFKDYWDAAEAGESGYLPSFTPWFEEDTYRRRFENDDERGEFTDDIGRGKYGEDEPDLLKLIPERLREWAVEWGEPISDEEVEQRTLEHLYWRRWAIPAKCEGDVNKFHQEYPSTPEEAFLATGRRVFKPERVRTLLRRTSECDPAIVSPDNPGPVAGILRAGEERELRSRRDTKILVPQTAVWVPRSRAEGDACRWRVWEAPQRAKQLEDGRKVAEGQYLVAADPMSGAEDEELAHHAIQVINHRTLEQVAEYSSQEDPDELARVILLAALHYNRAWVVVESTGGWGGSILRRLARDYRYPRVYEREREDVRAEKREDRLGFDTNAQTKPMLEDRANELLREEVDGLRSQAVARQMLTYVRDDRGRTGPEKGKRSDLLMAWMIAQFVATTRPVRPDRKPGATSTTSRRPRSRKTGW